MNEQEAITRAEAWYREQYHARAQGHLPLGADRQALREDPFLCIDLVPEQAGAVITVLLDLMGEEVALLEEGRPCPRCARRKPGVQTGGPRVPLRAWLKRWSPRRPHSM